MDQADPHGHPHERRAGEADALRRRRVVDFALRRRSVLAELQDGGLSLREVCDADVYLLRAAAFHGVVTDTVCPVCRKENLTDVSWVFGDALGRASGTAREPDEVVSLALTHEEFTVHEVEVCRSCSWNFLVRSYEVGLPEGAGMGRRRSRRTQWSDTRSHQEDDDERRRQ